jgi:hypothetical protein
VIDLMSTNGRGPEPPDDRYLSPSALHEAAEVLLGLAAVLGEVQGVWAEDAGHDAQRIRDLAEALARWGSRPPPDPGRAAEPDGPWDAVLALYVRAGQS